MKYIITISKTSNPKIMKLNDDGIYETITFSVNKENLDDIKDLVKFANVGSHILESEKQ